MTGDNRRAGIEAEWAKAEASLRSARILGDAGEWNDSVSRAYYAVFHAARCLLLTFGLEPSSHRGVNLLVGQHFVSPGVLDRRFARSLSRMQKFREEADYNRFFSFGETEATEELEAAASFLTEARQVLAAGGWVS